LPFIVYVTAPAIRIYEALAEMIFILRKGNSYEIKFREISEGYFKKKKYMGNNQRFWSTDRLLYRKGAYTISGLKKITS
jgi:hypothetical protein